MLLSKNIAQKCLIGFNDRSTDDYFLPSNRTYIEILLKSRNNKMMEFHKIGSVYTFKVTNNIINQFG